MADRQTGGVLSVTYDGVRQVISKSPDRRQDFEINNILPWFRSLKDTKLLGQLKPSILFDVIKNVQLVAKEKDELVIRQGDQGDCMYILLRGQVTIYHYYGVLGDGSGEDGDAAVAQSVATVKGEELRQQLGSFVVTLKQLGAAFGEVALFTDNGTRSASIIADEPTDLIVIDRSLYSRSVQQVLRLEFEQKANFIAQHPHFQNWAPKYRKQLTMALEKEILSYDHVVTKQAAPADGIYFIVSGEVKLVMDPQQHLSQFPKLFASASSGQPSDVKRMFNNGLTPLDEDGSSGAVHGRKSCRRHQPVEVCLLGVNEAIGDIELLMGLTSYMQTSICTQPCEVLVLNLKHYERLLVRRNPRTVDALRDELELRIASRTTSRYLTATVPLLDCLAARAAQYRTPPVTNDKQEPFAQKRRKTGGSMSARGDVHAPGAVFYRIRQNQDKGGKPQKPASTALGGLSVPFDDTFQVNDPFAEPAGGVDSGQPSGTTMQTNIVSTTYTHGSSSSAPVNHGADRGRAASLPDVEADNIALEHLEKKLRDWLTEDIGVRTHHVHKGQPTPRVTKFRRSNSEVQDQLKPGAKIVMRRKQIVVTPYRFRERTEHEETPRERSGRERSGRQRICSDKQLAYYRMALTEPVPSFTECNTL